MAVCGTKTGCSTCFVCVDLTTGRFRHSKTVFRKLSVQQLLYKHWNRQTIRNGVLLEMRLALGPNDDSQLMNGYP